MYCAYPIEQLFFGFFAGALTSWVGASFYFSRPFKPIVPRSDSDTSASTFTVPNVPGKSVAIFHIPNYCMAKIRGILEPYEEHYHNAEGREFVPNTANQGGDEFYAEPYEKPTAENGGLYDEPRKSPTFPTGKYGKYVTMGELEKLHEETLCKQRDLQKAYEEAARTKNLDQLESDLNSLDRRKCSSIREARKKVEDDYYIKKIAADDPSLAWLFPKIETGCKTEAKSSSRSDKECDAPKESVSCPVVSGGDYVTLGELEAIHKECALSNTTGLTKSEEIDIMNEFRCIIGLSFDEASALAASKGYGIRVLYRGMGSKNPAKECSRNIIGVRVSSISNKITEIIDVGGVDALNKGEINL